MTSEIRPDLSPCPKCGKHPVSLRYIGAIVKNGAKPYAVCCGGAGCRYYVMGDTESEAIEAWEKEAHHDE